MGKVTEDLLASAFGGESMAKTRYEIFSEIAERDGFENVARLFKAIAFAELVHARNHYRNLSKLKEGLKVVAGATFGPGDTSKNLELAIMGEVYEVEEMYPSYIAVAVHQGEKGAERSFKWALEAEKIHAKLYEEAKTSVDQKKDWQLKGKIWICSICGHTYVGESPPEKCPICNAPKDRYVGF